MRLLRAFYYLAFSGLFFIGCKAPSNILNPPLLDIGLQDDAHLGLSVSIFKSSIHTAGSAGSIVLDSHGNIFYPDSNGYVIQKISSTGVQSVFAGSGTNAYVDGAGTSASFYAPALLTIDPSNNLYVADGFKIRKITPNAVVTTIASTSNGSFRGIAADPSGNVYFVRDDFSTTTHMIQKSTPAGVISTFAGSTVAGNSNGTGTAAEFNTPTSLVSDSSGNIYVTDSGNFQIRKITPAGVVSTLAGSGSQRIEDGVGTSASFSFYNSYGYLSVDSSNNIYIGDMTGINASRTAVMRKVSPSGVVSTICGASSWIAHTGSCNQVDILSRFGVGVAPDGSIYYADVNTLYKISNQ